MVERKGCFGLLANLWGMRKFPQDGFEVLEGCAEWVMPEFLFDLLPPEPAVSEGNPEVGEVEGLGVSEQAGNGEVSESAI